MTQLNAQMAEWLADGSRQEMLLVDYLRGFMDQFKLTPAQAGNLIGQWLKAVYS